MTRAYTGFCGMKQLWVLFIYLFIFKLGQKGRDTSQSICSLTRSQSTSSSMMGVKSIAPNLFSLFRPTWWNNVENVNEIIPEKESKESLAEAIDN